MNSYDLIWKLLLIILAEKKSFQKRKRNERRKQLVYENYIIVSKKIAGTHIPAIFSYFYEFLRFNLYNLNDNV